MIPYLLDLHTHRLENFTTAIFNVELGEMDHVIDIYPEAKLSVGLHPWHLDSTAMEAVVRAASHPQVVAIGETGLDKLHAGCRPLSQQEEIFIRHIQLSEELHKPLIIHSVKTWDRLLAIHRAIAPTSQWAIHGFRGNSRLAAQLTGRGLFLSLGEKFNPETASIIPGNLLLAETDMSPLPITTIVGNIASTRSDTPDFHANLINFLSPR